MVICLKKRMLVVVINSWPLNRGWESLRIQYLLSTSLIQEMAKHQMHLSNQNIFMDIDAMIQGTTLDTLPMVTQPIMPLEWALFMIYRRTHRSSSQSTMTIYIAQQLILLESIVLLGKLDLNPGCAFGVTRLWNVSPEFKELYLKVLCKWLSQMMENIQLLQQWMMNTIQLSMTGRPNLNLVKQSSPLQVEKELEQIF